ncbi:MAG: FlgD immunoglobulin-like domain containing protein [Spirochaetaceae bacterium]
MNGKRILLLLGLGVLLAGPLFSAGEAEGATELDMPSQPRQYISPATEEGTNNLELPFSTVVVEGENVVVVEYNLTVFDSDGNVVWTESQVEEDRVGFFGRLFGADKPRVEVPDTLTWDGTYQDSDLGEDGEFVEDGDYTYQLFIRDDQENISTTPPFNVTVDNERPQIEELGPPEYRIFAPVEDSDRPTVSFPQETGREVSWTGRIENTDGEVVWERTWENPTPGNRARDVSPSSPLTWDGTYRLEDDDRDGTQVPQGSYKYTLSSTDRAGNTTEETSDWDMVVNTESGGVTLELEADTPAFSPNDDGRKDELPFSITLEETEGVADWEIEVRDPRRRNPVVRRVSGDAPVPEEGTFDGRDEEGDVLRDGTYEAQVVVEYENGLVETSQVREFVIDTEAPEGSLQADTAPQSTPADAPLVFGGTRKLGLDIAADIDPEAEWTATVTTPEDEYEVDLAAAGFEGPEIDVEWDGSEVAGVSAPDGEYSLQLSATDDAGNVGRTSTVTAIKETRPTPIDLTVERSRIAPHLEDEPDSVTFLTDYEVEEHIEEFQLEIRNEDGDVVRSVYRSTPFDEFEWSGEDNAGRLVEEGDYTASFRIIYRNGNRPEITGVGPVFVDRTRERAEPGKPEVELEASPLPFAPDDDGRNDTLTLSMRARSDLPIDRWSLEIIDPKDNGFKSWSGEGEPPEEITWDGEAEDGELVQSAVDYQAVFRVVDTDGNEAEVERTVPTDILVIRENGRLRIRIASIHFAPYEADLFAIDREDQEENFRILRRLATILDRYPEHDILVEGHANHVLYRDEEQMQQEQEQALLPLSESRAEEVRKALIILGIDRERMEFEGVGGARPVVDFDDHENTWKNRRVEFLLDR